MCIIVLFKIELKIKYIYLKILLLCYLKPHPYLEKKTTKTDDIMRQSHYNV